MTVQTPLADAALGTFRQFAPDASAARFTAALARRLYTTGRRLSSLAAELVRIGAGASALAPAAAPVTYVFGNWQGANSRGRWSASQPSNLGAKRRHRPFGKCLPIPNERGASRTGKRLCRDFRP